MEDAYKAGKLRAIGVSNCYPERLVDLCYLAEARGGARGMGALR